MPNATVWFRDHDPARDPGRAREAERVAQGVLGVLTLIEERMDAPIVCDACGCLCHPDEVCPGCRARRLRRP